MPGSGDGDSAQLHRLWRELRQKAGLLGGLAPSQDGHQHLPREARWSHDVLRHTAATMHYALHARCFIGIAPPEDQRIFK
jgi:hypothetical protein